MNDMRIVFLSKYFVKGGTTTHMLTLGKEYVKNNNRVSLISGSLRTKE
ncbi:hypothetical protein [Clostridium thermobutyricum]|nr:hypothetical protein [Clostridium thermobutyricum]